MFYRGIWDGQRDDSYGRFGKPQEASLYSRIRLKRHYKKRYGHNHPTYIEVQKKNAEGKWVSLGCFDSENEAVDILTDEVEVMEIAEALRELADVGS